MFSVEQAKEPENRAYGDFSTASLSANIASKAAREINGVTEKAARFGVDLDYEKAAARFVSIYNEAFSEDQIRIEHLVENKVIDTQIRLNSLSLCDIVGGRLQKDPQSAEYLRDLFSIEMVMIANKWAIAGEEADPFRQINATGARCSFVALTADPPHNGHTMMPLAMYVVQGADSKGKQAPFSERVSLMECGYEVDENTRNIGSAIAELRKAGIDVRHATADTDGRVTELKYLRPGNAQEQVEPIDSLQQRYWWRPRISAAIRVLKDHFLENGESKYSRHVLQLRDAAEIPAYFCGSDHARFSKKNNSNLDVLGHMALLAKQTNGEIPVDINVRNRNEANLDAAIMELGEKVQAGLACGKDISNIDLVTGSCNGQSVKITVGDVVDRLGTENGTRVLGAPSVPSTEPSQLGRALLGLSPLPDSGENINTVLDAFKTAIGLDIRLCYPGYATSSTLIRNLIKDDSQTALAFLAHRQIEKLSEMMELSQINAAQEGVDAPHESRDESRGPFGIKVGGEIDHFLQAYRNTSTH